jgi:hypothetical protein
VLNIKRYDTKTPIRAVLKDNAGTPIPLAGCLVNFILYNKSRGEKVADRAATILDENGGIVLFSFTREELTNVGHMLGEFKVTYSDGSIETFPNKGYIEINIEKDLSDGTTPPPPDTTAPANVTGLAYTATETSVTLTWSASVSSDVESYQVLQDGVLLTTVTGLTHTVSGLTDSTSYVFTVKAKDATGNIATGTSVTATTDEPAPVIPDEVTGLSTTNLADESLTLVWDAAQYATSYDVELDGALLGNVTDTECDVEGLDPATSYTLTVTAKNSIGETTGTVLEVTTLSAPTGDEVAYLWVGGVENE